MKKLFFLSLVVIVLMSCKNDFQVENGVYVGQYGDNGAIALIVENGQPAYQNLEIISFGDDSFSGKVNQNIIEFKKTNLLEEDYAQAEAGTATELFGLHYCIDQNIAKGGLLIAIKPVGDKGEIQAALYWPGTKKKSVFKGTIYRITEENVSSFMTEEGIKSETASSIFYQVEFTDNNHRIWKINLNPMTGYDLKTNILEVTVGEERLSAQVLIN